ncbi:Glycosyltransferase involved in cell wall bisynthesis [bacterium A37T11]|nr:Glycosyltransferase involved in cell wall bisynthesis [bacterium A37T11]
MRILYINALYSPYIAGGAEISLKLLVEGMQAQGHTVSVLSMVPDGPLLQEEVDGVKVYRAGLQNAYWPFDKNHHGALQRMTWHVRDRYNKAMKGIVKQVLDAEKPDVVSCHNLVGWSVSVWDAIKEAGIPIIQVLHDLYLLCPNSNMFKNDSPCRGQCTSCKILRFGYRDRSAIVDAVVGISQNILGRFLNYGYFEKAQSAVVHNARHIPDRGMPPLPITGVNLHIGYIGTLSKIKGLEWLIGEFKKLDGPVSLVLAGKGKEDYEHFLRQLAQDDPRIQFAGYLPSADFYRQIDLLVVPSLWQEPLGMVAIEGLANHLPVIASRMGGLTEIVKHGVNGILCDPEQPSSLGEAMRLLSSDARLYEQYALAARSSVAPMLSTKRMVKEYEQVIQKITSPK